MKPGRNPRRAYDKDGKEIPPMTLGNMRENGTRWVNAICHAVGCGHEGTFNADEWPDDMPVPDIALKLRCSKCGGKQIVTRPDWSKDDERQNYKWLTG